MARDNAFGRLVHTARSQRGWTQEEVAQRWGHTREYVSQVERAIRDLGAYTIVKAQAQAYSGNLEEGIALAIRGVDLAKQYNSKRHISRVRVMYDRLSVTPAKSHARMRDLKEALADVR